MQSNLFKKGIAFIFFKDPSYHNIFTNEIALYEQVDASLQIQETMLTLTPKLKSLFTSSCNRDNLLTGATLLYGKLEIF